MDWGQVLLVVLPIAGTISGIAFGWTAKARETQRDIRAEAGSDTALRKDVEYIKARVDDICDNLRTQGLRMDAMAERLTRVEESAKQAHKRIDRLEASCHGASD